MINVLVEYLADKYPVFCQGCGERHRVVNENGRTMTLHPGLANSKDTGPLPTPNCVVSIDFVKFKPCDHCCPQSFATCPDCELQEPGWERGHGAVTEEQCECYLGQASEASVQSPESDTGKTILINTGGGAYINGSVNTGRDFVGRDK